MPRSPSYQFFECSDGITDITPGNKRDGVEPVELAPDVLYQVRYAPPLAEYHGVFAGDRFFCRREVIQDDLDLGVECVEETIVFTHDIEGFEMCHWHLLDGVHFVESGISSEKSNMSPTAKSGNASPLYEAVQGMIIAFSGN